MIGEIFRVNRDGDFVPTNQVMGIPEFKNLWEKVPNPEIHFLYIHYMLYPTSLFSNIPEADKEDVITKEFPVDKTNPYFIIAYKKAEQLYETPLKMGLTAAKKVYETMNKTMMNIDSIGMTFGRDGNYTDLNSFLKNSSAFMEAYMETEKRYNESIQGIGNRELGFDDKTDYVEMRELDLN